MDDRRIGYAPAARLDFEEPEPWHYANRPYPLGIPKRVLDDPKAMGDLWGFKACDVEASPLVVCPSLKSMTDGDFNGVKAKLAPTEQSALLHAIVSERAGLYRNE